ASPDTSQQNTTLATFLTLLAIVLIMATDLHQLFIGALVRSYSLFPFGHAAPARDFGVLAIRTLAEAFALAIQLIAPIMVFSLIFNIATGLVGRAMPHFQIFFAASPLTVLLGLSLLALSLGVMGTFWVDRYRQVLSAFG
ncbi:MAG TPA: flagellar biosynthetic protein FliR, partial [Caulobacteraceae bacterium]|nr:flagellar biosynthetic protein FliR [Caulobacteraceae bacterium]